MTILQTYRKIQLLSIDVVIGALLMTFMTSQVLGVENPAINYGVLGAIVWLIYSLDHLIDASRIKHQANTPRHRFHQRYFLSILISWIVVFLTTVVFSLWLLPTRTIYFGIIGASLVVIHFMLIKLAGTKVSMLSQKELGIAVVYTLGVCIGPISMFNGMTPNYFWLYAIQVFLLAYINLLEFSYFEMETDKKDGHTSLTRYLGNESSEKLIYGLCLIFVLTFVSSLFYAQTTMIQASQGVILLMFVQLYTIIKKQSYYSLFERYRVFGDMVFIFPVMLLLLI